MPYSLRHTSGTPGTAVLAIPTGWTGRLGTPKSNKVEKGDTWYGGFDMYLARREWHSARLNMPVPCGEDSGTKY